MQIDLKNNLEPKPKGRAKGKAKAVAKKGAAEEPAAEEPQEVRASQQLQAERELEPEACDGEGTPPMDEIDEMATPVKRLFEEEGVQVDAARLRELKAAPAPATVASEEWIQFLTWKEQVQPKSKAKAAAKASAKEKAAPKAKAKTTAKAKAKAATQKNGSPVLNSPSPEDRILITINN